MSRYQPRNATPEQILEFHSIKRESSECWLWTGPTAPGGYGRAHVNGVRVLAHRLAYEVVHGPIPEGLEIDHLCFTNNCVNPAHLEAVSRSENLRRAVAAGVGAAGANVRKTHCPKGHPYSEENTRITEGRRRCRTCLRERARAKRREIANAA